MSVTEPLLARAMNDAGALTEGAVFLITVDVDAPPPKPQLMIVETSAMQAARAGT